MKIEPITYRQWRHAYRCSSGAAELVVVAEIGPRILSLRWRGSSNLLYEDNSHFRVSDWRLYGGHRFTVAPEGQESYAADNCACEASQRANQLLISAPPQLNGTRRTLVIGPASDGFDLHHLLDNESGKPWRGAPWAITCVPPAMVVAPRPGSEIRFWPGTRQADWNIAPDHVSTAPHQARGKIGWHSDAAWLASLQPHATLVIHNPNPPPAHASVDDGCNLEIFSCAHYFELETLGGEIQLQPGARDSHLQRWRLLEPGFAPSNWADIGAQAGCSTTPSKAHAA